MSGNPTTIVQISPLGSKMRSGAEGLERRLVRGLCSPDAICNGWVRKTPDEADSLIGASAYGIGKLVPLHNEPCYAITLTEMGEAEEIADTAQQLFKRAGIEGLCVVADKAGGGCRVTFLLPAGVWRASDTQDKLAEIFNIEMYPLASACGWSL